MDYQSSATVFENVQCFSLDEQDASSVADRSHDQLSLKPHLIVKNAQLEVRQTDSRLALTVTLSDNKQPVLAATWAKSDLEFCKAGLQSVVIRCESSQAANETATTSEFIHKTANGSYLLRFGSASDASSAYNTLIRARGERNTLKSSVFERRTESSSAEQYFQFYSLLSQQQNMLQDFVRTSTYQRAILANAIDFRDKVVMDVGAGSGILSFFAVQAGAKRVYAVEASASAAQYCETLVNANRLAGRIIVVRGKLEEIELDEQVDVLISEPLGYMLLNERMLETFLHAKKFLRNNSNKNIQSDASARPDAASAVTADARADTASKHPFAVGRMFPTRSELFIAPFSDDALFSEVQSKANFWFQSSFYGCVNLNALREAALLEYFRQPVVDTFDIRVCCATPFKYTFDFASADESDLVRIEVPLKFTATQNATIHGLAFWFDVAFVGSATTVWLSTAPTEPLTHWYQVRCLLPTPLFARAGQIISGHLLLSANARQSYDVDIELSVNNSVTVNGCETVDGAATGAHTMRARNTLDLKNPLFRYTGAPVQPPPGSHTQQVSPTELFWQAQQSTVSASYNSAALGVGTAPFAMQVGAQCQPMVNGGVTGQSAAFQTVAAVPNGAIINQQFVPVANAASYNVVLGGNSAQPVFGATMQQFMS